MSPGAEAPSILLPLMPGLKSRPISSGLGAPHAAVHGLVGEAVRVLVFVAQGVDDLEAVELGDFLLCLLEEGPEDGAFDLVLALDLLDHELGVGDDAETAVAVGEGEVEGGEQAGVLGEVVGLDAEEFREFGEDVAVGVLDEGAEAGGAGVAARAAVAVGGDPTAAGLLLGRTGFGGGRGEQGRGSGLGRH